MKILTIDLHQILRLIHLLQQQQRQQHLLQQDQQLNTQRDRRQQDALKLIQQDLLVHRIQQDLDLEIWECSHHLQHQIQGMQFQVVNPLISSYHILSQSLQHVLAITCITATMHKAAEISHLQTLKFNGNHSFKINSHT